MERMKKTCTKCNVQKSLDLFSKRKKSKDGHSSWCRECFKVYWEKRYYQNHKHYRNSHNQSRNKIRKENARKVFEYLAEHPCINCGESDPIVLEFDHRDRVEKVGNVANLVNDGSWKRVMLEIQKCDVLCANCHRRKSAAEFNYMRHVFVNF